MNATPESVPHPERAGVSAQADSPGARPAPPPRRLFVVAVIAAVVGFVITLSFGYADHDPKPHGVRLAVAAAPPVAAKLAAGLQQAEPGGFRVVSVSSGKAVVDSVRAQASAGGLIVPQDGAVTIVTAGATGISQQQAITGAFTAAAQALHRPAKSLDAVPVSKGDRAGLSSFVFGLGLLLPSVLGGLGIFLFGMRLRVWWRVAAGTLLAALVACGGVLALDPVLGALTGAGGAMIGVGFLGSLSFVLFVAALQAVVGLPGTALAAVAFIFVGNAVSGGSVPVGFLPDGFRQIAPWLPNNAIVRAARDVVYFHGHDLGHPLFVLGLWPVAALAVIAAVDLLHLSERRRRPADINEIYGTPAFVHVRRRVRHTRAGVPGTAAPAEPIQT
jgi:hypothetical protein